METRPLISVITIFLDAEPFIQEAIESVLAQTYESWELLLVDDGSTDGSTRIALDYADRYPERIRYLQHDGHQNHGMSASRNLGIREARGHYVALLDADDVYLAEKLERQAAILSAHPTAAMVYSATTYWYSWSGLAGDLHRDNMRTLGVPPDTLFNPPTLTRLFLQDKARTPGTCSVLMRRDAIERVGGFDERFRGMFEDQVFFCKLCLGAPVFVMSGSWDQYRQHPGSWCHASRRAGEWDPGPRPSSAREAFLNWLEAYLIEQKVADSALWEALTKQLWPYRHPVLYRLSGPSRLVREISGSLRRFLRRGQELLAAR